MATLVVVYDPLLFFRPVARGTQPFFTLEREGNFSRYVYAGLMRNLSYEMLWIGPSYVTPFGRGADPRRELVVSMGNMSGWEMTKILRLERLQRKAKVINVLISEQHLTEVFAPGWSKGTVFPTDLWGRAGELRYLFDPYMLRLAGRYLNGSDSRPVELASPEMRRAINEAYFWMRDEPQAQRTYWKQNGMKSVILRDLGRLRGNLRQLAEGAVADMTVTSREEKMLKELSGELGLLAQQARVNLIFAPRHISAWGTDYGSFLHHREIKRRIIEDARQMGLRVFDFQGDGSICLDPARFYDSGHFTERGVQEMRDEIFGGVPRERSVPALFAKFLGTDEADDRKMVAEMPD